MNKLIQFAALIIFCLATINIGAQLPPKISIPGNLKDAEGAAVEDGDYTLEFRLYDQANDGVPRWTETATVSVEGGLYTHLLGSVTPLTPEIFDVTLFLGIKLGSLELRPRTELTYAPYTFASETSFFANKVICSGAVGDIKYSILNPTQFTAKNGDCWVPMDGTSRPNSKLASILGTPDVAADASGMFLRAHEYTDGRDPDRTPTSPVATTQGESFLSHTHTPTIQEADEHSHTFTNQAVSDNSNGSHPKYLRTDCPLTIPRSGPQGVTRQSTTSDSHTHILTIDNIGGAETRPKNINLYTYIRIN